MVWAWLSRRPALALTIENRLSAIENRLSKIDNRKSKIGYRKSTIENRKSAIENRQSKIENRLSKIDNQKSKIGYRKSTIDNRKSKIGYRKSTIENRKSKIGYRKSTIENRKSKNRIYRLFRSKINERLSIIGYRYFCPLWRSIKRRAKVKCSCKHDMEGNVSGPAVICNLSSWNKTLLIGSTAVLSDSVGILSSLAAIVLVLITRAYKEFIQRLFLYLAITATVVCTLTLCQDVVSLVLDAHNNTKIDEFRIAIWFPLGYFGLLYGLLLCWIGVYVASQNIYSVVCTCTASNTQATVN